MGVGVLEWLVNYGSALFGCCFEGGRKRECALLVVDEASLDRLVCVSTLRTSERAG